MAIICWSVGGSTRHFDVRIHSIIDLKERRVRDDKSETDDYTDEDISVINNDSDTSDNSNSNITDKYLE